MSGFRVGAGALSAPAQRLKQIAADLDTARSAAGTAASSATGTAGDARVAAAAEAFGAGVTAVLGALGDDAGLLADKVQQAGVTYEAVDRTAVPAQ
jgi:CO/xanthine dehydrogenase Mo-binding subunit